MYSPMAMLRLPAMRPAMPASTTVWGSRADAPATPMIRLTLATRPSVAPNTAGRRIWNRGSRGDSSGQLAEPSSQTGWQSRPIHALGTSSFGECHTPGRTTAWPSPSSATIPLNDSSHLRKGAELRLICLINLAYPSPRDLASTTPGRPEGQPVNHHADDPGHQPQDPIDDCQRPGHDQEKDRD